MTGPEPVDLPGALPTDSIRRGVEPASPTVDDSVIIGEEKYGQLYFIHYACSIFKCLSLLKTD